MNTLLVGVNSGSTRSSGSPTEQRGRRGCITAANVYLGVNLKRKLGGGPMSKMQVYLEWAFD